MQSGVYWTIRQLCISSASVKIYWNSFFLISFTTLIINCHLLVAAVNCQTETHLVKTAKIQFVVLDHVYLHHKETMNMSYLLISVL